MNTDNDINEIEIKAPWGEVNHRRLIVWKKEMLK